LAEPARRRPAGRDDERDAQVRRLDHLTEPLPWQNSTLISRDVESEIAKLKEEPGKDINVIGSGELVQTLIASDLVDEYQLMLHPIVLGGGKRLFRDGTLRTRLELVDTTTTSTGVLILAYVPARES
jgi:dihydrofolate reductase